MKGETLAVAALIAGGVALIALGVGTIGHRRILAPTQPAIEWATKDPLADDDPTSQRETNGNVQPRSDDQSDSARLI
jgi:hypothetical protein